MRGKILRKILVVIVMVLPAISYSGCRKQPKCGCEGDKLFSFDKEMLEYTDIYYTNGASAVFQTDMYTTFYFCNPVEMYPAYEALSGKSQIRLSGEVFWECSYLMSSGSSSSYYYSYYKVYNIKVTAMESDDYGK